MIASMNTTAYVVQAWLPLLVWQQVDAPRYTKGYITSSILYFLPIPTVFGIKYLHRVRTLEKV